VTGVDTGPSFSVLTLEPAVLRRTFIDGNVTRHPESHYLDWVVDGQSLHERIPLARGLTTALNRAWLPTVVDAIEELHARRQAEGLGPDRIALYVCGECGDLGCGAVTATLTAASDTITWSDFAWDNGHEATDPIADAPAILTFTAKTYADAFKDAEARVAAMPYDPLAHEGRRFLWPWQWGWRLPK
jgi:hypothetical protein